MAIPFVVRWRAIYLKRPRVAHPLETSILAVGLCGNIPAWQ